MKKSIVEKNRLFKCNPWSQPTGALDFYDSLDFVTRFYSMMQQGQQELYDCLKPHDPSVMSCIDAAAAQKALQEFQLILSFMDGSEVEYEGREYVEDEQVMGSAEKQIFYAKEIISELTSRPKQMLDPFLVAKIDIQSINFFDFPKLPVTVNKYKV